MTSKIKMMWGSALIGLVVIVAVVTATSAPTSTTLLQRLALAATTLGPATLLVTAYFVTRQLQEATESRRATLFDCTAGRILELDKLFISNPEARPFIYDGEDVEHLPARDKARVMTIAEMHVDFFDTELLRRRTFPRALEGLPPFDPWIRGIIASSPAVCQILIEDRARGEAGWYDEIHDFYAEAFRAGVAAKSPPAASA